MFDEQMIYSQRMFELLALSTGNGKLGNIFLNGRFNVNGNLLLIEINLYFAYNR